MLNQKPHTTLGSFYFLSILDIDGFIYLLRDEFIVVPWVTHLFTSFKSKFLFVLTSQRMVNSQRQTIYHQSHSFFVLLIQSSLLSSIETESHA